LLKSKNEDYKKVIKKIYKLNNWYFEQHWNCILNNFYLFILLFFI
jgi:hypothetical protein